MVPMTTCNFKQTSRYLAAALALWAGLAAGATRSSAQEVVRYASPGVKLPGNQFLYDSGFELLDFDGDGKLDVFLPNSSMMAFSVHLNEGTRERPEFGHALGYPVNITEAEPQCIEHNQTFTMGDLKIGRAHV